jgi:hypothetical protein
MSAASSGRSKSCSQRRPHFALGRQELCIAQELAPGLPYAAHCCFRTRHCVKIPQASLGARHLV